LALFYYLTEPRMYVHCTIKSVMTAVESTDVKSDKNLQNTVM